MQITLVSTLNSVISLLKEVEQREKVAEQAVQEADRNNLDILATMDELKQALQRAKKRNQTVVNLVPLCFYCSCCNICSTL